MSVYYDDIKSMCDFLPLQYIGKGRRCSQECNEIKKIIFLLLSYLNFYRYKISVPNKKENIENLQKKLGEVLGLIERAA